MARRRKSVRSALRSRIPASARLLVAVSGGKDSIVLLHGLLAVKRLLDLHLEVCHVDHGLRKDSGDHASFVEDQCLRLSVPCHSVKLPRKPAGVNEEGWAREHRYMALTRCMKDNSLELIATAHTANDVAETLLIRLLANKELSGIRELDCVRSLIRPLVEVSRQQIDEYACRYDLKWVDDSTNFDTSYVRNRVRHEVIPPLIELFGSSVVWSLAERGMALNADYDGLRELVRGYASEIGEVRLDDIAWTRKFVATVEELPGVIQWRVAQEVFCSLLGRGISESKARDLLQMVLKGRVRVQIEKGRCVELTASGLLVPPDPES